MNKFIKKIFSYENLKKAMIFASLTNPNLTAFDRLHLTKILRDMDEKNINQEIQIRKAA